MTETEGAPPQSPPRFSAHRRFSIGWDSFLTGEKQLDVKLEASEAAITRSKSSEARTTDQIRGEFEQIVSAAPPWVQGSAIAITTTHDRRAVPDPPRLCRTHPRRSQVNDRLAELVSRQVPLFSWKPFLVTHAHAR